jgi:hypothetical protein
MNKNLNIILIIQTLNTYGNPYRDHAKYIFAPLVCTLVH